MFPFECCHLGIKKLRETAILGEKKKEAINMILMIQQSLCALCGRKICFTFLLETLLCNQL